MGGSTLVTQAIYDFLKHKVYLINGEIGQYFGMRMIEENNVLSNTIGGSAHNGEAIVCGFEPVHE